MKAVAFSILLLASLGTARAQVNYEPNGSFGAGVDGWEFDAGTANANFSWDPAIGDPSAGSLRIDATWPTGPPPRGFQLKGACVPIPAESFEWVVRARVRNAGGLSCYVTISTFLDENCEEPGGGLIDGPNNSTNTAPDWLTLFDMGEFPLSLPRAAISPNIGIVTPTSIPGGSGSCWFDDVEFIGPAGPSEIPTQSPLGLALLAAVLASAGWWTLTHVRRRQVP